MDVNKKKNKTLTKDQHRHPSQSFSQILNESNSNCHESNESTRMTTPNNFGDQFECNKSFENKSKERSKQDNEYFESRCNELERQLRSLKQRNNELEAETSNYQSALGVATSFNLSDNDPNHTVQLNKDILALHDTLGNYVTNLKPNIDVNIKEAKKLLRKYKCRTVISDKNPIKPVIKAALQRCVLEYIIEQANHYFTRSNHSNKEYHLE